MRVRDRLADPGIRAVVVTAHPDDEALWCGGLMARFRRVDWTVICCSIPRRDPVRAWKFFEACARLGGRGQLLPFTEADPKEDLGHLDVLRDLDGYDVVVTHGPAGEYGHRHHRQVHDHVASLAGGRLLTIGMRPGGGEGRYVVDLDDQEREAKLHALRAYDHVLPWRGTAMTKWEALLAEYGQRQGFNIFRESYDEA